MFAVIMVHERIPTALYLGNVNDFNATIDSLDLRDELHTKILKFIRDEGGENVFIVESDRLVIQKKKIFSWKGFNVRPEPKLRVLRELDQLQAWFKIYRDRLCPKTTSSK